MENKKWRFQRPELVPFMYRCRGEQNFIINKNCLYGQHKLEKHKSLKSQWNKRVLFIYISLGVKSEF